MERIMASRLIGVNVAVAYTLRRGLFLLPLSMALGAASNVMAQDNCRYLQQIFGSVDVTPSTYASAVFNCKTMSCDTLTLDVCEPNGDILDKRPVLIYFHGGHFNGGTKNNADAEFFCRKFAKTGYAGISANYRLEDCPPQGCPQPCGCPPEGCPPTCETQEQARADMGAVVRWVRYQADNNPSQFRFDPDYIFVAGYGAGGITTNRFAYDNVEGNPPMSNLPGSNETWWPDITNHDVKGSFALDGTIPSEDIDATPVAHVHVQALSKGAKDAPRVNNFQCNVPPGNSTVSAGAADFMNELAERNGHETFSACYKTDNRGLVTLTNMQDQLQHALQFIYDNVDLPGKNCE